MQTNNKLREALTKILNLTSSLDEDCAVDPVDICDIARAALAEPVKNCEVGTVEEQEVRFDGFCMAHKEIKEPGLKGCSDNCPFVKTGFCDLHWAQMPYEEGGAK